MSFFSGLHLFYPGRPSLPTVGELRRFCDGLRAAFVKKELIPLVELQYGENDPAAFDATHEVRWDATQTVGTLPLEEDRQPEAWHHLREKSPWPELWPSAESHDKTIHRAYISLGLLTAEAGGDLRATSSTDGRSGIVPDSLGVSINPEYAMTLATEPPDDADLCYGFLSLSFSGNGCFTWQPLDAYWRSAGHTATMQTALRLCREAFPVPAGGLEPLKAALGDRFLNRDEYQPGDWIVSVSETG